MINVREPVFNLLNRYRDSHSNKLPLAILASSSLIKTTNIKEVMKDVEHTNGVMLIFVENNNNIMGAFDCEIIYLK